MNKAEELRKLFADENEICISDCKFIPEAYPNDYTEWLEKKIQYADEVSRDKMEKFWIWVHKNKSHDQRLRYSFDELWNQWKLNQEQS